MLNKENNVETIRVYHQQKNVYFELTMDAVTKEVIHYQSKPLNDVTVSDVVQ